MKKILLPAVLAAIPAMTMAVTPLWLRDASISPDGQYVAFQYHGDLWRVSVAGGNAQRLTTTDDYEAMPIWSPDSRTIAFSSDRNGNDDIYIMPAEGGAPTRLTYNSASETPETFTPDGKYVVYSASIQDPASSAMFPTSRLTELYQVPVKGGASTQVLGTPARYVHYVDKDSKRFLYQDAKGMENEWRKHQQAAIANDVWLYDARTGKHTNLTHRQAEDRNPVSFGETLYMLSERDGGAMNVYSAPLSDPSQVTAITSFKTHPVRFLSVADNGTLCYTWDGEIYTQVPGGKPTKLNISIVDDRVNEPYKISIPRPTEMSVSPDGKSIAFIARGDVFVTSVDYATTKQITNTPEGEKHLSWGHDSKSLIYTSERDGKYNIYQAKMGREDDPNFPNATLIVEEPLFKADGHERTAPDMSPDGKKLAFILDRNILAVRDMESGKVTKLTDGSTYRQRDGAFPYNWSPDSRWIALEVTNRDPYTDIAIINVDNGQLTNITQSGYFDEAPRWTADGNAIVFRSEMYGMRNHASWGSMYDVMMVFMNQKAYDDYKMNKEDAELAENAPKKDNNKDDKSDDDDDSNAIDVDVNGIEHRIVRVTPFSSSLADAIVTADGDKMFFITSNGDDNMLWEVNLRENKTEMLKTISSGLTGFETSADGKQIFILGRTMNEFSPTSKKLTPITYSGNMRIDPAAERQYMFDNMVREERERFYDVNMHGVDWTKLSDHYRKFLPHISNNNDFSEMASELLGELNVSHTGCRASSSTSNNVERTASLGLLYDLSYQGNGLKIAEVVTRSPFDNADSKAVPGVIVEKVNGELITPQNDYTLLLTDMAGRKTLVSFYDPVTGERWDEVVKPISSAAMNNLLYDRWVEARARDVDNWSNGRLGYVHIKAMNDAAFRKVYADAMGKYNDREGLVVDIRWNGGGRLHEDVEVFLTGEKYLTQVIRGKESCDMPSRRWNKPSIMVMSEACYSNAHGTPWVYKHQNIGKLVGMPVAGTMTSVNWVDMQDTDLYYGIPIIGYLTAEGNYLENTQLDPDIIVANDPAVIVVGEDTQLRTAVETLLKDLSDK